MGEREVDVIVIGAGPAGEVLAGRLADRAHETGLVESRAIGGDAGATQDVTGSPRATFTDPQVAAVGITEAAAREAGLPVRTVQHPGSGTAGASFAGRSTPGSLQGRRLLEADEAARGPMHDPASGAAGACDPDADLPG
jgi:pyruvate/2-oxoglutarate dehydrogenase complex dihydrolipoamide dehydrogenase (E3) component